jgi:hypothetical protein
MSATVVAHGLMDGPDGKTLKLDSRTTFVRELGEKLAGKPVTLTVEEEKDQRSLAQNARFWLICQYAADVWSVGRPLPIHKDEAKLALCRAFLGMVDTPLGPVPKRTSTLTVAEMAHLQEQITAWFASEGTPLPLDGVA